MLDDSIFRDLLRRNSQLLATIARLEKGTQMAVFAKLLDAHLRRLTLADLTPKAATSAACPESFRTDLYDDLADLGSLADSDKLETALPRLLALGKSERDLTLGEILDAFNKADTSEPTPDASGEKEVA